MAIAWPPGYRYVAAGEVEARSESFSGLGVAMLVAVFGILAVLVLEFGSFRSMLIVFGVVPLGITGALAGLFLTGYTLSFTSMIGMIALVGIEIKNSILLVDFTNQLRAEGMPLDDAIAEAGEVRFLPILLTSLTAIGGLMPLAVQGSGLYSPLAIVIIGGLISSTLLARLVTPVMYKLLRRPSKYLLRLRRAAGGQPGPRQQYGHDRVQHDHRPQKHSLGASCQPDVYEEHGDRGGIDQHREHRCPGPAGDPSATSARPVTRATMMARPLNSSPSKR